MSSPDPTKPLPLVVLISGRGSNLQAIIDAIQVGTLNAEIRAVISNVPDVAGLDRAQAAGIPTQVLDHSKFDDREAFDSALIELIDRFAPELLVLAGFMRVLSPRFVRHFAGRMFNIHPSLLPEFRGLNTHARALAAKRSRHGASVHFVTEDLDGGPIVAQASVPVFDGDTPDALATRVLEQEHRILPQAIRWFGEGRLTIHGDEVWLDGALRPEQGLQRPLREEAAR